MLNFAMIGLLMVQAAQAPAPNAAKVDPLSAIAGEWQVVPDTGKALIGCKEAQRFAVSADRRSVTLTEKGVDDQSIRYLVLRSEADRILMFIDDEERKTDSGDPVLWWAYFEGNDRFRWRQYGWAPDSRTAAEWRRCPRG